MLQEEAMNQYYRVHAVIDLDAICHNIREVKRVVGEGVKVTIRKSNNP